MSAAKSKIATPEMISERVLACALKDEKDHNDDSVFKVGFEGKPFSICIHSDMPTALDDVRAARKAVDEANVKLFSK